MTQLTCYVRLLIGAFLLLTGADSHRALQTGVGMSMNPHVQLYQFIHSGDSICIAHVTRVDASAGPRMGQETLNIGLQADETLWGASQSPARTYLLVRPASRTSQLKFPDPLWGRVDIRQNVTVLLVTASGSGRDDHGPVYVDEIPDPNDPTLRSIREVLKAERSKGGHAGEIDHYLHWLSAGTIVQKLFAGEALAKEAPPDQVGQVSLDLSTAFVKEQDDYVKISLGTWLWDDIFPRADTKGKVAILNATIRAATSQSPNTSDFALDRLSEADSQLFREPGVEPLPGVVRLLEQRKGKETDAKVRQHLDGIIAALRR